MFRPGKWFQKNSGDNVTGAAAGSIPTCFARFDRAQSSLSCPSGLNQSMKMQLREAWQDFAFLQTHRNQEHGIVKLLVREVDRETQLLLNVSFLAKLKHKAR
jgi:hypothetical protein